MPELPPIRPGRDSDDFISLIGACWSQYPGVLLDVDGEMPELRALAGYYAARQGALWAAEHDGRVVGMIATKPDDAGAWEICRVYVHPSFHGGGLGHRLLDTAEAHARAGGAARLVLWTDTRFDRAHRFYEKRSYVRSGPIRVLDDISHSLEFAYAKPVTGMERLDAAAAASAIPRLSTLLSACVAAGAGLCWLPPLAPETARAYWQEIARQVAAGQRILLAGWAEGVLVGSVSLRLAAAPGQQHLAAVEALLLHPDAPADLAPRLLMQAMAREATRAGRHLLVMEPRSGELAETVCRSMHWQEAGRIPGYARSADGSARDKLIFWKRLD